MKVTFKTPFFTLSGSDFILSRLRDFHKEAVHCYNKVTVYSAVDLNDRYKEQGIHYGYRANYSFSQVIISLFKATNETLNFWTHFLPSLYFMWKLVWLFGTQPVFSDVYLLPLACYLASSCLYPLMSSLAHAFSCMSPFLSNVCFFMDYFALSFYSWGTAMFYYAYALPESALNTYYASLFLPIAAFNTILSTLLACSSRLRRVSKLATTFRCGSFLLPYIWVSVPIIYRIVNCDESTDSCGESSIYLTGQFIFVLAASFFYATHLPEIWYPGRFDILGHSHNLLHVFGITATYLQMCGGMIDLIKRRSLLEDHDWVVDRAWTYTVTPYIIFSSMAIIFFSSLLLKDREPFHHCCSRANHVLDVSNKPKMKRLSLETSKKCR